MYDIKELKDQIEVGLKKNSMEMRKLFNLICQNRNIFLDPGSTLIAAQSHELLSHGKPFLSG